jgi:hypothetical protein
LTTVTEPRFIRYQTVIPHRTREGMLLGVFATVNTLSRQGRLTPEQEAFRRAMNDWFDAHLPLPTEANPDLYADAHPRSAAWFKHTATAHLAQVPGYLRVLEAHGIEWREIVTDNPGTILYEDAFQVVAIP